MIEVDHTSFFGFRTRTPKASRKSRTSSSRRRLAAAAKKRLKDEVIRDFLDAFGVRARKGKRLV